MKTLALVLLALALVCPLQMRAADVRNYALIKNQAYKQTNASDVVQQTGNAFTFVGVVDADLANVSSASLLTPLSAVIPFSNSPSVGPFAVVQSFSTKTAMDSMFTSGNYTFTINTVHDGTKTPTLTLPADAYPNAPQIVNYDEAQLLRPELDFTLQWAPMTGGSSLDNIVLTVSTQSGPTVFSTPIFGQAGALNGTVTSVNIPAGTIATGGVYSATLTFAKISSVDIFQYLGVPGVVAFVNATDFKMRAISIPFLTITNTVSRAAQLRFNSDPGRTYDIRESGDLSSWNSLVVTTAVGGTVIYTDTNSPALTNRFYRLEEP